MSSSRARLQLGAALAFVAIVGCHDRLDTTRTVPERGTLGQEIFAILRKDVARAERQPVERARAMDARFRPLVDAIDGMAPPSFRSPLQDLLVSWVDAGLYDDGRFGGMARAGGDLLRNMANQPALLEHWAREERIGQLTPRDTQLLAYIVDFPELRELNLALAEFTLAHDGLDPSGAETGNEAREMREAMDALGLKLQRLDIEPPEERMVFDLRDFLAATDEALTTGLTPLPMVLRDARGVAKVLSPGGAVPTPFVDADGDGRADVNALGQHVQSDGSVIVLPPHVQSFSNTHDGLGRALLPGGAGETLAYTYTDISQSVLRALLDRAHELVEADILYDLPAVTAALGSNGVRIERTDGTSRWRQLDTEKGSPLLDLLWALARMSDYEELPAVLELTGLLLRRPDLNLAGVIEGFDQMLDRIDADTRAATTPGNSFFDDLMDDVIAIAQQPGLLESIMAAGPSLDADLTAASMVNMLTYNDPHISEEDVERCGRAGICPTLSLPVDHDAPGIEDGTGTGAERTGNRSLFERALHLVADTTAVHYELNALNLPLPFILDVRDLAAFYFDVLANEFDDHCDVDESPDEDPIPGCVGDVAATSTTIALGIPMCECPEATQINEFITSELGLVNEPVGCEGYAQRLHHGDALHALDISGTALALRPITAAFSDVECADADQQEAGAHPTCSTLLARLFLTLHRHWAAQGMTFPTATTCGQTQSLGTDLRSYEPLLIDILTQTRFLPELTRVLGIVPEIQLADGRSAIDVLADFLRFLLIPDANLRRRDGSVMNGRSTRFDLLRIAINDMDAAVETDEALPAWTHLKDTLIAHLFGREESSGQFDYEFTNPYTLAINAELIDVLHEASLDGSLLGNEDVEDASEILSGRELGTALDLIATLEGQGRLRTLLRQALLYVLLPPTPERLDDIAIVALDLLQDVLAFDPSEDPERDVKGWPAIADLMGRAMVLAPGSLQMPFQAMRYLQGASEADGAADRMGTLMRNAFDWNTLGEAYHMSVIATALEQDRRVDPADEGPKSRADYESIFSSLADYIADEDNGIEQLIDVIQGRKGDNPE